MSLALAVLVQGCATDLVVGSEESLVGKSLAVGRVTEVITGESQRIYPPGLRSFELINKRTFERFREEAESDLQQFMVALAPGDYELVRVQISEGPFMSMENVSVDSESTHHATGGWCYYP